jgi:hypothetical protein
MIATNLHFVLYYQFLRHSAALTRFGNHNSGGFRRDKIFNKLVSSITACLLQLGIVQHIYFSQLHILEASFYMFLQGQTGKKGSCICWLVPTLHFLWPFVDFLAMKLDELRGPDFTMRCFSNSVYTLRGADWCALLFRASNRISMFAYTMVIWQTSTWICVLHLSLCLTDEF